MLRKAFFPAVVLFGGLAVAALVQAQDPGNAAVRTSLADQLARIRDELAGRTTPHTAGDHNHAGSPQAEHNHTAAPLAEHNHDAHTTSGGGLLGNLNLNFGQDQHNHPSPAAQPARVHNHAAPVATQPAPPAGTGVPATPGVYENPYALSDQFQPATQARPAQAPAAQQGAVRQDVVTIPAPRATQPTASSDDRLTLQERLAQLIQGGRPEPRSTIVSGGAEPEHIHDEHAFAEPLSSGAPAPARPLVQTDPSTSSRNGSAAGLSPNEPTPAKPLTLDEAFAPGAVAASPTSDNDFMYVEKSPQLTASVSGPKSVNIGRLATYTVVLQNVGTIDAGGVDVAVEIPAWAEVSRATGSSGGVRQAAATGAANGGVVWRIPAVVAQSRERLELDLVPRDSRPMELAIHISQAPMTTTTVVDVKEPKLQIVIAGPDEVQYGETKIYQLTVANPGDGVAENVVIDLLPLSGQQTAVASHELGTLRPGQSKSLDIELSARQPGELNVKAQATAEGGLVSNIEKSVLVRRAGLRLDVEAPSAEYASTPVKYLISVSNPGNATARNVKISATLPPGAEVQNTSGGVATGGGKVVTWKLDALAAQGTKVLELECILSSPGVNRLQVVSDAETELTDAAAVSTDVVAVADLKLEISDPQGPVAVGDTAVYKIYVRNRGTKTAESVEVVTFFSEGVEPIEATGGENRLSPGQVIFETIGALAPGEERVLQIQARADREGNHSFRTELVCRPLDTRLIAEETTRFYGGQISPAGPLTQDVPHTALLEPIPAEVR